MRKSITIPPACRERYVPLDHPALAHWKRAGLIWSGVSDLVPGYRIVNPDPPWLMLIATVGGRGWAETPAGRVALAPGSMFVGVPREPVAWSVDRDAWRIVWWYIEPTPAWRGLATAAATLHRWPHAALHAAAMEALLDRLAADGDDPIGRMHAATLLAELREFAAAPAPAPEADAFASAWRAVGDALHEPWSVPTLARAAGVSVATFQRLCHRRLGASAHQELIRLRLERARDLIRRSRYPLRTVAERVGFADPYTFSAAYRRWAGHPPSAERARGG